MTPEQYDAWYRTPRGSWIGLLHRHRLLWRREGRGGGQGGYRGAQA